MTNRAKRSGVSDTVHSTNAFAFSTDSSQFLAKAAESYLAATAEWHREVMAFASMRLEKDGDVLRGIMRCKNPAEAMGMQVRWVQETVNDYSAEMTKLMTIYTSAARR